MNLWKELQGYLQSIPRTGANGFEGVAQQVLMNTTGELFRVAAGGLQPGGDASNEEGTCVVQAKQYKESTQLNQSEIIGDIERSLIVNPGMECYALVTTRSIQNQLRIELNAKERKTGLDIFSFGMGDDLQDLGILCVTHWRILRDLPAFASASPALIQKMDQAESAGVFKKQYETIKADIQNRRHSCERLRQLTDAHLQKRFAEQDEPRQRLQYPIRLTRSIPRDTLMKEMDEWWSGEESIAVIEGDEGVGKSWGAAQAVSRIRDDGGVPVFWLDSIDWHDQPDIHVLIRSALRKMIDYEPSVDRYASKLLCRYDRPVLVVLDGANERQAVKTVEPLLHDFVSTVNVQRHIRLLFTSRPLPGAERLWRGCTRIPLGGFSDEELDKALVQVNAPAKHEIPGPLLPMLRLPRYFHRCLELRDRFSGFDVITKEMVLWEELKAKVREMDPQVMEKLGIVDEDDAEEILRMLVQGGAPGTSDGNRPRELLNECFGGNYEEVRRDLQELRILDRTNRSGGVVSREHVVLGWALYLKFCLENADVETPYQLVDVLRQNLEPVPSDDCRTEALFVALQLTVGGRVDSERLSKQRAALLAVWYGSHNAWMQEKRLAFWAAGDSTAYLDAVETLFEDLVLSSREQGLVGPLAKMWTRGEERTRTLLAERLRKWLLLVWRHDQPDDRVEWVVDAHTLPVARTESQLRLSAVAISILSQRPDTCMLETLALSAATETQSLKSSHEREFPAKHLGKNVTMLMRWGYREEVLPELLRLANHTDDERIRKGLRYLTADLGIASPPGPLRFPPGEEWNPRRSESSLDAIRSTGSPFVGESGERGGWFVDAAPLAIRMDLPELGVEDQNRFTRELRSLVEERARSTGNWRGKFDMHLEACWPWVARYDPESFRAVGLELFLYGLRSAQPEGYLSRFRGMLLARTPEDQNLLFEAVKEVSQAWFADCGPRSDGFHLLMSITEILLLNCVETQFADWLRTIADHRDAHRIPHFYPICTILWTTRPSAFHDQFRREAMRAKQQWVDTRSDDDAARIQYWTDLWGYTAGTDDEAYKWACSTLCDPQFPSEMKGALYRLAAKSNSSRFPLDLFASNDMRSGWSRQDQRMVSIHAPEIFSLVPLEISREEVLTVFDMDYAGSIFMREGRENDLISWGREVMSVACQLAESPPVQTESRIRTEFHLGPDGRVQSLGPEGEVGSRNILAAGTDCWGIDASGADGLRRVLSQEEPEASFMKVEDKWREDQEMLQRWEGFPFHAFNGRYPLKRWASSHPDVFFRMAEEYLKAVSGRDLSGIHLGLFTNTVLSIASELDPARLETIVERLPTITSSNVFNPCRVEKRVATCWDSEGSTMVGCEERRRKQLLDCGNDEECMRIAIAAMSGGTEGSLLEFCREFLADENACIRNLAVSLLPWLGCEKVVSILEPLRDSDPSTWVRGHASWAYEVAQQEKSCRVFYEKLLEENDLVTFSAGLQTLEPALLPPCRWWRREIGSKHVDDFQSHGRKQALLEAFWQHWDSRSSHQSGIKVFNRKLTEWYRGQHLDSFVSPRMAPWWTVAEEYNAN